MVKYPAVIDGEKGAYGVVVPDIPGVCCGMGETVDEALADAEEALAEFAAMFEEEGRAVPPPSPIDSIHLGPGEMVAYVPLRSLAKT